MNTKPQRLAVLVAFSGNGGVERVVYNLLQGFAQHGIAVDLLAVVGKHGQLPDLPWPNIRVINLNVKHTHYALPALVRYLRDEPPDVLMAAKDRAVRIAVLAKRISGAKTRLVGQLHMTMLGYLRNKHPLQRWLRLAPMRWLFPSLDLIIGVSQGVVEDTLTITGLPRDRVLALPNPVLTPKMYAQSQLPVAHPWFADSSIPVILGVGRLTPEKDFATLIRAFKRVSEQRQCRLLILGEGPLRAALEQQIAALELNTRVALPGFVDNPYAYMAKSALFVLSSAWEGSPTVLAEALGLGIPVVSTDCPSGPTETLAAGRYGPLVAVGDDHGMAAAILQTLDQPLPAAELKQAVTAFSVEHSALRYLQVLGFIESTSNSL